MECQQNLKSLASKCKKNAEMDTSAQGPRWKYTLLEDNKEKEGLDLIYLVDPFFNLATRMSLAT